MSVGSGNEDRRSGPAAGKDSHELEKAKPCSIYALLANGERFHKSVVRTGGIVDVTQDGFIHIYGNESDYRGRMTFNQIDLKDARTEEEARETKVGSWDDMEVIVEGLFIAYSSQRNEWEESGDDVVLLGGGVAGKIEVRSIVMLKTVRVNE